jgi:hypothetical protein
MLSRAIFKQKQFGCKFLVTGLALSRVFGILEYKILWPIILKGLICSV